ncbi:hypothetical protein [Nostoc sp. ChiQUE01b]|uniref:hypothetical protein n=1 Tax=Nostoc sp. ChiQUE01b TaxID=3075376 RepID=UPI002AD376BC|nr:hypothetical protein [Nostoc sp. ChiQUE01b]MDZ8263258.1 hypothetical protein [Nostoc sp. ChiQUE01b]
MMPKFFFNAIKHWEEALNQDKNNPEFTAVVNENLARAYQQIGENKAAIASLWQPLMTIAR